MSPSECNAGLDLDQGSSIFLQSLALTLIKHTWGQLFRKFNFNFLEIPCFAVQDQVTHLTFVLVFQSKIGLDHPDPVTHFFRFPNLDY